MTRSTGNFDMRKRMLALGAATMAVSASMVLPAASARATPHYYQRSDWHGDRGISYPRDSVGAPIVGSAAAALLGRLTDTQGGHGIGSVLGRPWRRVDRSPVRPPRQSSLTLTCATIHPATNLRSRPLKKDFRHDNTQWIGPL